MREQRHGEHEALREIEREITKAEHDDAKRDVVTLSALLAIGKIVFARFDNVDEQLDRIELALKEQGERIMTELEDAQAAQAKVAGDVENVRRVVGEARTAIGDLQQQVADLQAAAGENAELKAGLTGIATGLNDIDAQLDIEAPDAPTE